MKRSTPTNGSVEMIDGAVATINKPNSRAKKGRKSAKVDTAEAVQTMPDLQPTPVIFLRRASDHPELVALRVKRNGRYQDISWGEYGAQVCQCAAGLITLGLERGEAVALWMGNRPEFVYTDIGGHVAGAIMVAIYTNTTPSGLSYILNHCEARFLVVDTIERLQKTLEVADQLEYLEQIIVVEWQKGLKSRDNKAGRRIKLQPFSQLCQIGADAICDDEQIIARSMAKLELTDTAIIVYTSGTTGPPKGAMLSHRNISFICTTMRSMTRELTDHETFISFLPMAHVLERIGCLYYAIHNGGTVGFADKLETVAQDILEIRPTVLYGVPRFFEKIYNGIHAAVESGGWIKQKVFQWATKVGRQAAQKQMRGRKLGLVLRFKYWLASRLVFEKLQARLGGRVKYIVSGGAPLSAAISEFFYSVGLPIMEAYGATETSAPATITLPDSLRCGTVGKPIPNVDVKIADDGEILIRGAGVCKGYYKDPEATARAFVDGWYYTGDIGQFDREGNLVITDRKKDLIITSAGKNIAPQNIENLLKRSPYINQAMVHGDRRKYLTALVTLNPETIQSYAEKIGLIGKSVVELAADEKIYQLMESEIAAKNRELASYERIKKFAILPQDFTVENGELTPTLKVKRKIVTEKHRALLDSFYEKEFSSELS